MTSSSWQHGCSENWLKCFVWSGETQGWRYAGICNCLKYGGYLKIVSWLKHQKNKMLINCWSYHSRPRRMVSVKTFIDPWKHFLHFQLTRFLIELFYKSISKYFGKIHVKCLEKKVTCTCFCFFFYFTCEKSKNCIDLIFACIFTFLLHSSLQLHF